MKILHITYDYPDAINSDKTNAIKQIIDICNDSGNTYCISLNRTSLFKNKLILRNGNILSIYTFGLPKGLLFTFTLLKSVKRVLSTGLNFAAFDFVHAHKLTFEGPIAYYLSRRFNLLYIITIQQTDFKVLRHKPLIKSYYLKILSGAERIILISPWMESQLYRIFVF